MAENTFQVTISTPDGIVYNGNATMLVMTTTGGQLGLMANHQPLIASLAINAILIKHQDTGEGDERVAVNGGFIEFHGNVATIAASSAELPENIDVARAESAKERSEAMIKKAQETKDTAALNRAEVHLRRAINRLHLSGK
ncbi:MAG: F0F1 ATP synthase subunit epsilon [Limosilactobacillus gorillae]|jgi:F-type H+-transporting ATPase subunit epsilon|uniref:F0F1 ATP synthase subunit epsilon n=1 Tax=Limosilactobacillus gorillae TaxID=1450649 RepID=UPI000A50D4E2|nr:F0F1 ATP synthase subunit epsilon [Limosilactobacillus gorillae]MDO4854963.1 F0F1 ATP synthase subunit epsilon [Limosilactobacillus gorillae]